MQHDDRHPTDSFRPDLEGLRGVAILLVVLFHAGVAGVSGGFVGVDVFFVLSGFLITGLLVRERERSGRISLRAFYARRARRILPASAVVLVATLAASWIFLAPLDLPRVAEDGVAVALSVGNIRFAANATDYFAADVMPSPLLHYWSLGVEEQFYLIWPTLLILAARGPRPRVGAGLALAIVVVGSFVASTLLTDISAPWAFYSLPTRAWQLGLGGLLAVLWGQIARVPRPVTVPIGWLGLLAVLASIVIIDSSTPYPGLAALLPTLGSAAVIFGGLGRWSVGTILVAAPLRFLGRISYSLYLIHWPVLVLPAAGLALGEQLPFEARIGLAGLSVALATASYRLIEEPIHRGRRFALPPGRTLALAGATIAASVLIAVGVDARATQILDAESSGPVSAETGPIASPSAPPSTTPRASATPGRTTRPKPSPGAATPKPTRTPRPTPPPTSRPTTVPPLIGPIPLPAGVQPSLRDAANDWDPLLGDHCLAQELQVQPPDCVYGNKNGTYTVALVGDSHAEQWFPAVLRIADARGWRLLPFIKFSCRFVDLPEYSRVLKRPYTECDQWKEIVVSRLQSIRPDLTLVASAGGLAPMNPADANPQRQGVAMARLLVRIPGRIAVIMDTPQSNYDVPSCISRHVADTTLCATPRQAALTWYHGILERAAVAGSGAALVDLTNAICPNDPCPVVLDGMIVYRDSFHLTATFAASLADQLASALAAVDGGSAGSVLPSPSPS